MEFRLIPKAESASPTGGPGKTVSARGGRRCLGDGAQQLLSSSTGASASAAQIQEDPLHCKSALNSLQSRNVNHSFH